MINKYTNQPIWVDADYNGQSLVIDLIDEYTNTEVTLPVTVVCSEIGFISIQFDTSTMFNGIYSYTLRTCQDRIKLFTYGCQSLGTKCGQIVVKGEVLSKGLLRIHSEYSPYKQVII